VPHVLSISFIFILINQMISVTDYKATPVTLSLLDPNIFLSTLSSDTLSICFSLNMRAQASHVHQATGKI
jgi:hypothetical protein